MAEPKPPAERLKTTPLDTLHRELGARMVPFAGYEMPLHYQPGIVAEHLHTRAHASVFDVSHMGQAVLAGGAFSDVARRFETLVPGDIAGLASGAMRYTLLLNDDGGCRDDLIVARGPAGAPWGDDSLLVVANAAFSQADFDHIAAHADAELSVCEARALIAVQGPGAAAAIAALALDPPPPLASLAFMQAHAATFDGADVCLMRSGYTGEDGFEISIDADRVEALMAALLAQPMIAPAGLGARDSLRLEAGLCLMGQDLDETTSPVEAGLAWTVAQRRRKAGAFPGAARILGELETGPARTRVGIRPAGRSIVRAGAALFDAEADGEARPAGRVTSGGFGPSVGGPIAMGYVDARLAAPGTALGADLRGRRVAASVAALPFVAPRTRRP